MKIYLNREPVSGPWGGGNKTVSALTAALKEANYEVVYRLEKDIDLLFCFDPRPNIYGENYIDLVAYKRSKGIKLVQRVGDLGTHSKPELTKLVKNTFNYTDYFIFPSQWAKDTIGFTKENFFIIDNAPLSLFHKYKKPRPLSKEKIKIVTHHWSTNLKKGFDYYKIISKLDFIEFSYIGALPPGISFKNYSPPTGDMNFIAEKLSENDIYMSASVEEAGANHVVEAMACGLPVLFHEEGGSIKNYCENYGMSFNRENLTSTLEKMIKNYDLYKTKAMSYNNTIEDVVFKYMEIINEALCN